MASNCDEVLTLNVGGVLYTTTRSTLVKHQDSMLAAMFGGQFIPTAADQQGNYFIDRDGYMFRHVLNFLRSDRLCLPQGFKDFDLLQAEADFYQIPSLIHAIRQSRGSSRQKQQGFYIEILDFEETAYFYRFYSDPPRGINSELKNGGVVISGSKEALLTLPLPEKVLKEVEVSDMVYRTINVSSATCSKMRLLHELQASGWQLITTAFTNNTDSDGSYMVQKYIWFLPNQT